MLPSFSFDNVVFVVWFLLILTVVAFFLNLLSVEYCILYPVTDLFLTHATLAFPLPVLVTPERLVPVGLTVTVIRQDVFLYLAVSAAVIVITAVPVKFFAIVISPLLFTFTDLLFDEYVSFALSFTVA